MRGGNSRSAPGEPKVFGRHFSTGGPDPSPTAAAAPRATMSGRVRALVGHQEEPIARALPRPGPSRRVRQRLRSAQRLARGAARPASGALGALRDHARAGRGRPAAERATRPVCRMPVAGGGLGQPMRQLRCRRAVRCRSHADGGPQGPSRRVGRTRPRRTCSEGSTRLAERSDGGRSRRRAGRARHGNERHRPACDEPAAITATVRSSGPFGGRDGRWQRHGDRTLPRDLDRSGHDPCAGRLVAACPGDRPRTSTRDAAAVHVRGARGAGI